MHISDIEHEAADAAACLEARLNEIEADGGPSILRPMVLVSLADAALRLRRAARALEEVSS